MKNLKTSFIRQFVFISLLYFLIMVLLEHLSGEEKIEYIRLAISAVIFGIFMAAANHWSRKKKNKTDSE